MNPTALKERYIALDGIRGVLALVIVFMHICVFHQRKIIIDAYPDLFFYLSGFVLAHAYGEKIAGGMGFWHFAKVRLCRLYPLYFAGLVFGAASLSYLYYTGISDLPMQELLRSFCINMFYFPHFIRPSPHMAGHVRPEVFLLNAPFWTLGFEVLLSGLFFFWIGMEWKKQKKIGILLSIALILFSNRQAGLMAETYVYGIARTFYPFFAGMMMYRFREAIHARVPSSGFAFVAIATLLPFYWTDSASVQAFYLLYIFLVCPLILGLGISANIPAGSFSHAAANYLGRISYPVYCLHWPVMYCLLPLNEKMPSIIRIPVLLGISLLVAHISATTLDPFLRKKFARLMKLPSSGTL